MENAILIDWVFHFNPYTKLWAAINRSNYSEYWNDSDSKNIIRSKEINTLVELIIKADGDIKKINKLVHETKN